MEHVSKLFGTQGEHFMYVRVLEPFCGRYGAEEGGGQSFRPDRSYRVHQIVGGADAGYVVLVNEAKELCWVDRQHVRVASEDDFPRTRASELELPIRIPQSGPYTA